MTPQQEFLTTHGAEFRRVARKPMFEALLHLIDAESPIKKTIGKPENDLLHGAVVFLNQSVGWEQLRKLLVDLRAEPTKDFEAEDKFSTPEKF